MKATSKSLLRVRNDRRAGSSQRGRTKGEGATPAAFLAHQIQKRGWVINPATGRRESVTA